MPDLTDELRQLADDAARRARPMAVDEVIQDGDRRTHRTSSRRRRTRGPGPGRRWPGWVAPLAAAASVTAVIAVAATVSGTLPGSGSAAGHGTTASTVYVSYPTNDEFSENLVPISTATSTPSRPVRIGTAGGVAFTPDGKTAYADGPTGALIPISTATNTPGKPIAVPLPSNRPYNITMDPDGKTAYLTFFWELGSSFSGSVIPVSTATNTLGKPIRLAAGKRPYVGGIVFSPDGKTAYAAAGSLNPTPAPVLSPATIVPINTATNTPGKPIRLSRSESDITITPDGKTLYVDDGGDNGSGRPSYVTPVDTATRTPGAPIRVSAGGRYMAITPDGKTLYVSGSAAITPISTATNTPGKPIPVNGAGAVAITPDGKTLYAIASRDFSNTIIPMSTATNTAGRPIPVAAEDIVVTPDGKTLYAATRQGIVPISTATNKPGKPIHPPGYRGASALWIIPGGP